MNDYNMEEFNLIKRTQAKCPCRLDLARSETTLRINLYVCDEHAYAGDNVDLPGAIENALNEAITMAVDLHPDTRIEVSITPYKEYSF